MANIQREENVTIRERLNFRQSYTSLILGILAVVIVAILAVGLVKRNTGFTSTITPPSESPVVTPASEQMKTPPTSYKVVEGDTLWAISEKYYKSGYNWVDIASASKLKNPDLLYVGTDLTIPKAEPKILPFTGISGDRSNAITGGSYKVVKGDTLWDVSVRAYGDGYKWVDIAKASRLDNPDAIDEGQTLTIPR